MPKSKNNEESTVTIGHDGTEVTVPAVTLQRLAYSGTFGLGIPPQEPDEGYLLAMGKITGRMIIAADTAKDDATGSKYAVVYNVAAQVKTLAAVAEKMEKTAHLADSADDTRAMVGWLYGAARELEHDQSFAVKAVGIVRGFEKLHLDDDDHPLDSEEQREKELRDEGVHKPGFVGTEAGDGMPGVDTETGEVLP